MSGEFLYRKNETPKCSQHSEVSNQSRKQEISIMAKPILAQTTPFGKVEINTYVDSVSERFKTH